MAREKRPGGRDGAAKAGKKKTQQFAAAEPSNRRVKLFAAAQTLFIILTLLKLICEVIEQVRNLQL
ncbi:hypothetical protein G113_15843 [Aeromonas molluscorum 848]|uniref:Uncharacterized protein n=1 Tax=Aeromonas molluscorum 848 TaxID=1268236 RepID=R1H6Q4_9GAMM|nr:hypothetical protein G113_15843 [Aeromonas molluscorum 848]